MRHHATIGIATLALVAACAPGKTDDDTRPSAPTLRASGVLPTGVRLDPAGAQWRTGNFPLAAVWSPDSSHVVLLLNGYRDQGVQVLDAATGAIVQTLRQPAAFLGLAFAPDGRTLYASGGNGDVVYRYDWSAGTARLRDSLVLAAKARPRDPGTRYPAGLAPSPDGARLYVAENLADSLAVVDVASGRVVQRLAAGRYPYAVAVARDGRVWVSSWGTNALHAFAPAADGALRATGRIDVGRHPSAMLLSRDDARLFVTSASTDRIDVVDTRAGRSIAQLRDHGPAARGQGSTPQGVTLDDAGTTLYVAEADANAVAVFALSPATSGVASATAARDTLLGRAPVGWWPTVLLRRGTTLLSVDAKGRGTAPSPRLPQPGRSNGPREAGQYTLDQVEGTVTRLALPSLAGASLAALTARVAAANGWTRDVAVRAWPPITHVIYVIKENRTYDQVLADLPQGDGDTTLLFFPRAVTPNHHALAERFGLYDRFFVNAEVSADGHNWSVAAYTTDYLQKTMPANYSGRGRSYDYEGTNRGRVPMDDGDDDASEPAGGYLWDLAQRKGITFRNFGEFVLPEGEGAEASGAAPAGYRGVKPFLVRNTSREFPGYDLRIADTVRADVWLRELAGWVRAGAMPRLQVVRLPNDHTSGARAGMPTPRAHVADNDLALGRMIEGLSRTPFWASTAVFVVEDDAQNGPDHVDSHRSLLLVISPWATPGVVRRFVNTTDVLATIEALLGLDALSPFDHFGRPLRHVWRDAPDTAPYAALRPSIPLDERNPRTGTGARDSRRLGLGLEDRADEALFNRVLWRTIKGERVPYPGTRRMAAAELVRAW